MFATGLGPVAVSAFSLATMLIAIPTGVKIFNWLGTVWGGSIRLKTPMLFALGFIAMFTIGGLSGVTHSIVPADTQQTDTYYVVAHFHYVLFGGLFLAIFGGFYYWWPKIFGKMLNERLGQAELLADAHRVQPHVLPDAHPRPPGPAPPDLHVRRGHGLGRPQLPGHDRLVRHRAERARVPGEHLRHARCAASRRRADPWDARTLEWSIPTPVPEYNFAEIPQVEARDDFWHRKYTEDAEGRLVRLPAGGSDDGTTGAVATLEADDGLRWPRRRRRRRARRRPRRRARHPPAVAVVLPVRHDAGAADPRLRGGVQEPVARDPGRRDPRCSACTPGRSSPERRRTSHGPGDASGSARSTTTHDSRTTPRRAPQHQAGDVGLPVVGVPVLRRVHRDVPALPRSQRRGPDARRTSTTSRSRR